MQLLRGLVFIFAAEAIWHNDKPWQLGGFNVVEPSKLSPVFLAWQKIEKLAEGPAPGPAPGPVDPDALLFHKMDSLEPASEQGFHGEKVMHTDFETMTRDWHDERGGGAHPCDVCEKKQYKHTNWCETMCVPTTTPSWKNFVPAVQAPVQPTVVPAAMPAQRPKQPQPSTPPETAPAEPAGGKFGSLTESLKDMLKNLSDMFKNLADTISKAFNNMVDGLKDLFGFESAASRPSRILGAVMATTVALGLSLQ